MTGQFDVSMLASDEAERGLLAACLLSSTVAPHVIGEHGVRPDHFTRPRHATVMAAITTLVDAGSTVDRITVVDRLRQDGKLDEVGGDDAVQMLCGASFSIAAIQQYASDIVQYARWRHRHAGAVGAQLACQQLDESSYLAAEARMTADLVTVTNGQYMSSEDVANALLDRLQGKPEPGIPVPWPSLQSRLNGGLRKGELTAIIGPGHHGKSVVADMLVQSAAAAGRKVGLYINEMVSAARAERFAARLSGVDLSLITAAACGDTQLRDDHLKRVLRAMNELSRLPVGFINASGWTGRDIVRHANRTPLDLLVFDIVQRLPFTHRERRFDMDEAVGHLDQYAKRTGCHVVYTSHISRERIRATGEVPPPLMTDVSESKMLTDLPDNVIAFWREQDDKTKDPTDEGAVKLLKARSGLIGGFKVYFDGAHQTISEPRRMEAVA